MTFLNSEKIKKKYYLVRQVTHYDIFWKIILHWLIKGKWRKGRHFKSWNDNIKESKRYSISTLLRAAENRKRWGGGEKSNYFCFHRHTLNDPWPRLLNRMQRWYQINKSVVYSPQDVEINHTFFFLLFVILLAIDAFNRLPFLSELFDNGHTITPACDLQEGGMTSLNHSPARYEITEHKTT